MRTSFTKLIPLILIGCFACSVVWADSDGPSHGDYAYAGFAQTVADSTCLLHTGDVNGNGAVTSADVIFLVAYVFRGGIPPVCPAATGDLNCDGQITTADIIALINCIFLEGVRAVPAGDSCPVCDTCATGMSDYPCTPL